MAVKLRACPPARASMIGQLRDRSIFKKWRYSTRRLEMHQNDCVAAFNRSSNLANSPRLMMAKMR